MTDPIADAHVHFWDLEQNPYPWLEPKEPQGPFGRTAAIRHSFLPDDYRGETQNQAVNRIVHVEAGWEPADPLGEMRWIQEVADRTGAPHAHVAHVDLAATDVEQLIQRHAAFSLFRGVRDRLLDGDFMTGSASTARMADPAWRRGLRVLEERGLSFDLQAPSALAADAAALAAAHPRLTFVLTHGGYPPAASDAEARRAWTEGIERLADQPNVVTKLSGLMLAARRWDPDQAQAAAQVLLSAFGAGRVLAASNAPVDRLFVPIDEQFRTYRTWLADLSPHDRRAVLHDNTCRAYRV